MRKGSIALLSLVLASTAPAAVEAKSYTGYGYYGGYGYGYGLKKGQRYAQRDRRHAGHRYGASSDGASSYGYRYEKRGYARNYGYARSGRRYASAYGYEYQRGGSLQGYVHRPTGVPLTDRGIARFSGQSLSTSTTCLTPQAQDLLGRIQTKFGKVEIVSTCRPGATIAGTNHPSKHASGEAIDFRVPGRKAEVLQWLIANDRMGGIMTYSDMDHIHVDVGARFVALNRPSGRT